MLILETARRATVEGQRRLTKLNNSSGQQNDPLFVGDATAVADQGAYSTLVPDL